MNNGQCNGITSLIFDNFPDEGDDLGEQDRAGGPELLIGWFFAHQVKAMEISLVEFLKLADQVKDFIIYLLPNCRIIGGG